MPNRLAVIRLGLVIEGKACAEALSLDWSSKTYSTKGVKSVKVRLNMEMEKDRVLRSDQARLVWDAAWKRDALEVRLEEMGGLDADDEASRGIKGRIDRLSAFVNHYSFLPGGPFEPPYDTDKEANEAERKKAMDNLSPETVQRIEGTLMCMISHGGKMDWDGSRSPITLVIGEVGLSKSEWASVRTANEKLGFINYGRESNNGKIRDISLVTSRVDELINLGRFSEGLAKAWKKLQEKRARQGAKSNGNAAVAKQKPDPEAGDDAEEETSSLAGAAVEIKAAETARELAERAKMTPAQRAADTRRRMLGEVRQRVEEEVRAQNKTVAKERARLERERGQQVHIKIEVGDESFHVVTSGRMFSEIETETRVVAAVSLLHSAKARHVYGDEDRRWPYILSKVNLAQRPSRHIDRGKLNRLVEEAIDRGELSLNGSSVPSLTLEGLRRVRNAGIGRDTPGVIA